MKAKFNVRLVKQTEGTPSYQNLTSGNIYEVISLEVDSIRVINDYGEPGLYPDSWFSIADPKWPTDWVVMIGIEGERYAGPQVLSDSYFWERYFDGDKETILTFQRRIREQEKYKA